MEPTRPITASTKRRSDHLRDDLRTYRPYGGALSLFYDRSDEVLIEGPAGTGKSTAVLEKIFYCAQRWGGMRALLTRKTRSSMTESVLASFENKVIPHGWLDVSRPARQRRAKYLIPGKNGGTSEIVVGGLDRSSRIMSTEYDLIAVFEATECTEGDIEDLTTRCRNGVMPFNQLICDCNPGHPQHFLNLRAARGQMSRILSRHEDNPTVTEAYLTKLRNLSGARRKRLYEGVWAAQEGLVYETWNPDTHLVYNFEPPEGGTWFLSIDFGYRNPAVVQWWWISPDDILYLVREIYATGILTPDLARRIIHYSGGREAFQQLGLIAVCDHDAAERAILESEGIPTVAAYKDIKTGIETVEEAMRVRKDGQAGLYIMHDSLVERDETLVEAKLPFCTLMEFDSYIWPLGIDSRPIRERPVDLYNHGMDALRYGVCYARGVGSVRAGISLA